MAKFAVGKYYTSLTHDSAIYGKKAWCVFICADGSVVMDWGADTLLHGQRFVIWPPSAQHNFTEWKPEEWVVLMWGDEHKNSVVVNSEFFPSEQAAINKWVENPLYIGTKQVR